MGCGCLLLLGAMVAAVVAAVLIFRPNVAGIAAQVAGLNQVGDTAEVFAEVTPAPTVVLVNPQTPPDVTLDLGDYGARQLDPNSGLYQIAVGESGGGVVEQIAVATFTEAGLQEICRTQTQLCSDNPPDPRIRNPRIDLRPGGAVIYADVTLPQLGNVTQNVGIVLRVDDSRRQFEFAGVDINGGLFNLPAETFGTTISDLERQGNELLREISVQAGGGYYTLSEVSIDDTTLTVVLR